MADDTREYYKLLLGKWELECACGELQIYTFNPNLTYEVLTFPKTGGSRARSALGGKMSGNWYLNLNDKGAMSQQQLNVMRAVLGDDWVNPEKVLWFKRGDASTSISMEISVWGSLKMVIEGIGKMFDAAFAAFDTDSCGAAFVTFVDAETINVRMQPPCGGVLRRIAM